MGELLANFLLLIAVLGAVPLAAFLGLVVAPWLVDRHLKRAMERRDPNWDEGDE